MTTATDRETLEQRLHAGWDKIAAAELTGADVAAWEAFWLRLLHEYQHVCNEDHER